jgi:hypothetical protein
VDDVGVFRASCFARNANNVRTAAGKTGFVQGFRDRIASIQAPKYDVIGNVELSGPLRDAESTPIEVYISIAPGVLALFKMRGPSAIGRLVIPSIVDSLNRGFRRPWTHICVEIFELEPSLADRYSACAVVLECGVTGFPATIEHPDPHSEFG